ncbi:SHOCT-like domain-containing protein, partial [Dysosmobacter welbionis]
TVRQPQLPVPHGAGDEAPGGSLAEDRGGRTGLWGQAAVLHLLRHGGGQLG